MKTIYTTAGKFIIDDDSLQSLEKKLQRLLERDGPLPDITIDIPVGLGKEAYIRIQTNPDYMTHPVYMSLGDRVCVGILDNSSGEVYLEDLRKVPNVYFDVDFRTYIVDGELSKIPPLSEIDNKHWKQLARAMHRNAKEALSDHIWEIGVRGDIGQIVSGGPSDILAERYKRILSASQEFYRGKSTLVDFIAVVSGH